RDHGQGAPDSLIAQCPPTCRPRAGGRPPDAIAMADAISRIATSALGAGRVLRAGHHRLHRVVPEGGAAERLPGTTPPWRERAAAIPDGAHPAGHGGRVRTPERSVSRRDGRRARS